MTQYTDIAVAVTRLQHASDLSLPQYATTGSAGMDLLAAISGDVCLKPLERALIPTGIAIALPAGYEAQVRPRSGLALKQGISIVNSPGTIDADYRGEIGVILINLSATEVTISRGMRIAQLVIAPYTRIEWDECQTLPDSTRGSRGFGSTGISDTKDLLQKKRESHA